MRKSGPASGRFRNTPDLALIRTIKACVRILHDHVELRIMWSEPGKTAVQPHVGKCLLHMMWIRGNRGRPAQNRRA